MNKIKLLQLVFNVLDEEGCARVLETIAERIGGQVFMANAKAFEESKHPRDKSGKFTDSFGKEHSRDDMRALKADLDERTRRYERALQDERPTYWPKNTNETSILLRDWEGTSENARNAGTQVMLAEERIRGAQLRKKAKKMTEMAKEFRDIDETIDTFEEAYADRGPTGDGVKLKWPNTEQAKADRKKYKKLLRRKAELEKRIDWKYVRDEDDDNEEDD